MATEIDNLPGLQRQSKNLLVEALTGAGIEEVSSGGVFSQTSMAAIDAGRDRIVHITQMGDEYNIASLSSDFPNKSFHGDDAESKMIDYLKKYLARKDSEERNQPK